eukprot:CAMPEP_0167760852 /NCGR_PEP_ID=MMETSP0110_2-20121227/11826_1 /TAXON_ID=629695 /ORGANISM="Gymnochlora sp., Strain CCMP2014" /LENGTH=436 /DNA_ID=CAMNT_0007647429 /DNA_START=120 /DNA_END=1430 /DNA_ORIENTATION=-
MVMVTDAVMRLGAAQRALYLKYGQEYSRIKLETKVAEIGDSEDSAPSDVHSLDSTAPCTIRSRVHVRRSASELEASPTTHSEHDHYVPENSLRLNDYVGLIEAGLGVWGERIAMFCLILGSFGGCVAYSRFIQDNMDSCFGIHRWVSGLCLSSILIPLAMLRSLKYLTPVSMLGLVFGIGFVVLLLTKAGILGTTNAHEAMTSLPLVRSTIPLSIGIAAYCSEGVILLWPQVAPHLDSQAADRGEVLQGRYKCSGVVITAITLFSMAYLSVSVAGYILYREDTKAEITLNMNENISYDHVTVEKVASIFYCITLIVTFTVSSYILFTSYEPVMRKSFAGTRVARYLPALFILLRALFPPLCGFIAYLVPNFGAFISFLGSFMNGMVIYFLPNLLYLKVVDRENTTPLERGWCHFMLFYAFATSAIGTYSSVLKMIA